jgi:hypothetical protein
LRLPRFLDAMDGVDSITIALPDAVLEAIVERAAAQVAARLQPAAEPWVGVDVVAAHLACRRQRVYDLVCRRQVTGIPHRKECARLLFKLSQIDRWIESGGAA